MRDIDDFMINGEVLEIYVGLGFHVLPGGTLRMIFDDDFWIGSRINLYNDDIQLGGMLELIFEPDVDVASQVGRTIDLFNWDGFPETAGKFNVVSPYEWDLTKLYTTGEITLIGVPEPSSLMLASICMVGIVIISNRRLVGASALTVELAIGSCA